MIFAGGAWLFWQWVQVHLALCKIYVFWLALLITLGLNIKQERVGASSPCTGLVFWYWPTVFVSFLWLKYKQKNVSTSTSSPCTLYISADSDISSPHFVLKIFAELGECKFTLHWVSFPILSFFFCSISGLKYQQSNVSASSTCTLQKLCYLTCILFIFWH